MIGNKLKGNPRTTFRVGNTLFLFWTREPADSNEVMRRHRGASAGRETDESATTGQEFHGLGDANAFFLLGLSGNSCRVIIRDYLEAPLPQVQANLGHWFRDLTIAAATKDGAGHPTNLFSLQALSAATIPRKGDGKPDWEKLTPDMPAR